MVILYSEVQSLFVENVDVFVVAAVFVVVEAESYDEVVRILETNVDYLLIFFLCIRLAEHCTALSFGCALFKEDILKLHDCIARIYDVFNNDYSSAGDVSCKSHSLFYLACSFCTFIRSKLYGNYLAIEVESLHELTHEHDGSVENAEKDREVLASCEILIYVSSHIVNGG